MDTDITEPYNSELCKMIFIYNTLQNGWSVKMLEKNKFQFTNGDKETKKQYFTDDFIKEFIQNNINEKTRDDGAKN
tara:strand:- start:418 stop:645 length:228 start_codon:yes stop_codon:yes gene_type:complete